MKTASHEIVHVVQPDFLVNSLYMACGYETDDARPLAPGYYFALWPAKTATRVYGKKVHYSGLFATPGAAQLVRAGAVYLELAAAVAGTAATRARAEPRHNRALIVFNERSVHAHPTAYHRRLSVSSTGT